MRTTVAVTIPIILTFLQSLSFGQGIPVRVDPRTELISIVFRLAGSPEFNRGRVKSYCQDVDDHFQQLKDHPAVEYASFLREKRGIGYDAPMHVAVCLTEDYEYDKSIPFSILDDRWVEDEILEFISRLKHFAAESNFRGFLDAHAELFNKVESEG